MANIHTARRSGFITRGGRQVRETVWVPLATIQQATLAAASTALLFGGLSAGALALRPFTVIRTRGFWHVQSDQGIADERYQVAFGQAVVTTQAQAIGVTAVPTAATDADSDAFYVYDVILGSYNTGDTEIDSRGIYKAFDSKAMRKVDDGFDLVATIETFSTSSGAVVDIFFRTLLKLH